VSLKILYFAALREALGTAAEELAPSPEIATVAALRAFLARRGGAWQALAVMKNLRAAVNQQMAAADAPLADGDEVAFFPPVTGG
jgi:molybdopterin synthase sulfur carrier subunit